MNAKQRAEREQVIEQALAARTLTEVEQATAALRAYMTAYPDDPNIIDVGEPLALRQMGLEEDLLQAKAS